MFFITINEQKIFFSRKSFDIRSPALLFWKQEITIEKSLTQHKLLSN